MRFVWHDKSELPCPAAPVIIKTNLLSYHVAVYDMQKTWWIRAGKRYVKLESVVSGSERMTAWAYIGGEN